MLRGRHVAVICSLSLFLAIMRVGRQRRTHHIVVCCSRISRDFITMLLLSWVGLLMSSCWRKLLITPRILLLIIIIDCTIFSLLLLLVYEAWIDCLPTTSYYITWSMSLLFATCAWSPILLPIYLQSSTCDFFVVWLGCARSLDLLRLGWARSSIFVGDIFVVGIARNRIRTIMLLSVVCCSTLLLDAFFNNARARHRNSFLLHGFRGRQMTIWIWIHIWRGTLLLISINQNTLGCLSRSNLKTGDLSAVCNVLVTTLSVLGW